MVYLTFCTVFLSILAIGCCKNVVLKGDEKIVQGGTVFFTAQVLDDNNVLINKTFTFTWEDSGIPMHKKQNITSTGTDSVKWTYDKANYPSGDYVIQVDVQYCLFPHFCFSEGSARATFEITEYLNGELDLVQHNETRDNIYVSNKEPVRHFVNITPHDRDFFNLAPTKQTYWFIDCVYYGMTENLSFIYNYTRAEEFHTVEALVVADFTPLPPPTTTTPATTTTLKPNVTTTTTTKKPSTTTTTKPSTITTIKPSTTTTRKPNKRSVSINTERMSDIVMKNVTNQSNRLKVRVNGTLVPLNESFPLICNGSRVAINPDKTYGYFYKKLNVKVPVNNVNVTGNLWLQHDDLLSLNVRCQGSKSLGHCIEYYPGIYNVTGNESCDYYYPLEECNFPISRYFPDSNGHTVTVVVIIKNDVNKVVTQIGVTIYKAKVEAQLSVVVVPVVFSIVAVVIIVFGVAYYIQNRSSFIVEVADFNFGGTYPDVEYKTFRERLRDSILNAFSRSIPASSSETPVWPPDRKYDRMT